ncbi:MAG: DNA polymerase III subunit delta [Pseudomonadota bacterium]
MKLSGRAATKFCTTPDHGLVGTLIHGADGGQVAAARRKLVDTITEQDDLRLSRLEAAEARRDAARIGDEIRARGFFPGRRVLLIEGGTDGLAKPLTVALDGATSEDAFLIVTADGLPARSTLRKLFEGTATLAALHLFADVPEPADIEAALKAAGAAGADPGAAMALAGLGSAMDRGSFDRLVDTVALLARGRDVTEADVAALAPAGLDAELDALVAAVAEGQASAIGPLIRRLEAGGLNVVGALLALQRHFRLLLAASVAGGNVDSVRPPLYGPRKTAVQGQVRRWGNERLEQANRLLLETDARVRSAERAPDRALLERCALRLSLMAGR